MIFTSDNWAGVHPKVFAAMEAANKGLQAAYGADETSAKAEALFDEIFERKVKVFFVTTGGAANGLALSALVPPFGAVLCHEVSHVQMDEAGLPELYTGGAKLLPMAGAGGKMTVAAIDEVMRVYGTPMVHHVQPRALSLTQATEYGTAYTADEIGALAEAARGHGLRVHMDGARFSNAVARLGCKPADITWRAGVDVLSFGATKNGAMAAEAVVFFDETLAHEFEWRQKRAGHLWSKARFLAAQWVGFLQDDLWLDLARMANGQARKLADGLKALPSVTIEQDVDINEVFVAMDDALATHLRAAGGAFYDWVYPGDLWQGRLRRLVTSYATRDKEIEDFIAVASKL